MPEYVRHDAANVEVIPDGEKEAIEELKELVKGVQHAQWVKHRHATGPTHTRTQGIVKGELEVGELPSHLAQSFFAEPGRYPIAMRYSSEGSDPSTDDRVPQPRGLGMKVFNVPGRKMREDVDGVKLPTQDFEWNDAPALELANALIARDIFKLRLKYMDDPEGLQKALDQRDDAEAQKARDTLPNTHLAGQRQYSQTALRFGDLVAKFALVPDSETQKQLQEKYVQQSDKPTVLADWLQRYFAENEATYLFQAQLLVNPEEQLIEDYRQPWDEDKFKFETIGKITIPTQETFSDARRVFWEENTRLDPWHGRADLRPLGGASRLRKYIYPASNAYRRQLNQQKEIIVTDIDQIPN